MLSHITQQLLESLQIHACLNPVSIPYVRRSRLNRNIGRGFFSVLFAIQMIFILSLMVLLPWYITWQILIPAVLVLLLAGLSFMFYRMVTNKAGAFLETALITAFSFAVNLWFVLSMTFPAVAPGLSDWWMVCMIGLLVGYPVEFVAVWVWIAMDIDCVPLHHPFAIIQHGPRFRNMKAIQSLSLERNWQFHDVRFDHPWVITDGQISRYKIVLGIVRDIDQNSPVQGYSFLYAYVHSDQEFYPFYVKTSGPHSDVPKGVLYSAHFTPPDENDSLDSESFQKMFNEILSRSERFLGPGVQFAAEDSSLHYVMESKRGFKLNEQDMKDLLNWLVQIASKLEWNGFVLPANEQVEYENRYLEEDDKSF